MADGRPLLLCLDDLQWADELSSGWLLFLLRSDRLARMPVLFLLTERAEEETEASAELASSERCTTLAVSRLDVGSVHAVVSDMLADPDPPADLSGALHEKSEGNPFFIAEYLRALVLEGRLARTDDGRWHGSSAALAGLALPNALRDLVSGRLDALAAPVRRVLDAAAVLGRDTDVDVLANVLEIDPDDLSNPLWDLERRHLILPLGPGQLRFDHDKIREVTLARLDAAERRRLHARAAATIETMAGSADRQAELAEHWREAGERERARASFLAAARGAVSAAALAVAEKHYRAALALFDPEPARDRWNALLDLGIEVLSPIGRHAEALAACEEALADARALEDREGIATSIRFVCTSLGVLGRQEEAWPLAQEGLAIQRGRSDRRGEALALRDLGRIEEQRGDLAAAEAHKREALAILETAGDAPALGRALVNLAGTLNSRGGIEESERLMARALEIAKASGDRALTALTLHGLSLSRYAHGEHEQALAIASESASLFAAIGDRRNEATCLVNISASQYHLGRLPEAIGALEKAIPIVREMGDRPVEMMALKNLTEMRFETGDISEARALNARALALSRQMRSTRNEAMILASEADMERLTGDLDRATRLLEDASRIAAGVGDAYQRILLGISRARLALARGEDAAGILATTRSDADAAGLEHHYARELDLVESAIAAARDGRELFRGEEPEAIPEPLRRALSRGAVEGG